MQANYAYVLHRGRAAPTNTQPRQGSGTRPSIYSPSPPIGLGGRATIYPQESAQEKPSGQTFTPGQHPSPATPGVAPRRQRLRHQVRQPSPTQPEQPPAQQPPRDTPPPADTATPPRPHPTAPAPSPTGTPTQPIPAHTPVSPHTIASERPTPPDTATAPPPHAQNHRHITPASTTSHRPIPRRQIQPPRATTIRHTSTSPRQQNKHPSPTPPPHRHLRHTDTSNPPPGTPPTERRRRPPHPSNRSIRSHPRFRREMTGQEGAAQSRPSTEGQQRTRLSGKRRDQIRRRHKEGRGQMVMLTPTPQPAVGGPQNPAVTPPARATEGQMVIPSAEP